MERMYEKLKLFKLNSDVFKNKINISNVIVKYSATFEFFENICVLIANNCDT